MIALESINSYGVSHHNNIIIIIIIPLIRLLDPFSGMASHARNFMSFNLLVLDPLTS